MRTRRDAQVPISLFSFQDIITSVMGVVILVLLVMALELINRQLEVPAVQHSITRKQADAAIDMARQRIVELQAALSAGAWNELAGKSATDMRREGSELDRLIKQLDADLTAAQARVEQLRKQRTQADSHLSTRESDQTELERLKAELEQLEAELTKLTSSNTLLFRSGPVSGRQPWLVAISATSILAAPLGPKSKPINFEGSTSDSRRRQFTAWAEGQGPTNVYFVLMVQPGGAAVAKDVERRLRELGFGVGLDLLGSEQSAIDPEEGAATIVADEGGSP
jgi:hypothetical protein